MDNIVEHPLDRAAKAAGLTMQSLADRLGVTRAAVQQWKQAGRRVPAEHCPPIEQLCHGAVRCEELNGRVDWAFVRQSGPSSSSTQVCNC
ncbi:transcriptional regulator [Burkholderia contaminans]|uniref:transcriptional regulator n=2 Tax=Burkholderia contaminans TaxID=488447 RepID=UPI000F042D5D|nr:YdaS family helix-turn-helix protein [Burkholderia contaminans]